MQRGLIISSVIIAFILLGGMGEPSQKRSSITKPPDQFNCSTPLTWRIGNIEKGFNIDSLTIKNIMSDVASLWSEVIGRELIVYSDSGEIDLNFIYSEEQKNTDNEQELSLKINKMKLRYYAMKLEYQELLDEYQEKITVYNNTVEAYTAKTKRYKKALERLNDTGVFSREVNEELKSLKKDVEYLSNKKKSQLNALNGVVLQMKKKSTDLNNYSDRVNKLIFHYKDSFSSVRTFHQAVYIRAGDEKKINIYQFENTNKLRLVLAHEVGHALGLRHTPNPESVMYYEMDRQNALNLRLSQEDREAILEQCAE